MTVYRRHLTSSLYALRKSLERRRQALLGQWTDPESPGGLSDEDIEEADLTLDQVEDLAIRPRFADEEVAEIDRLLEKLREAGIETKVGALRQHLQEALRRFDQVLVFTQYTDTLDFLRQELLPTFGSRLAC